MSNNMVFYCNSFSIIFLYTPAVGLYSGMMLIVNPKYLFRVFAAHFSDLSVPYWTIFLFFICQRPYEKSNDVKRKQEHNILTTILTLTIVTKY